MSQSNSNGLQSLDTSKENMIISITTLKKVANKKEMLIGNL